MLPTRTRVEQRLPYFQDVEELIHPGFLSYRLTVRGLPISIRSLYPGDVILLSHYINGGRSWKAVVVAASIWMVDGYIVLSDRQYVTRKVLEIVDSWPTSYVHRVYSLCACLFKRVQQAVQDIQPYLYESHSRVLWSYSGKGSLLNDAFFGVPGVSGLGLNTIQKMWLMWNQSQDTLEKDQYQWDLTKTSLSAHSPKGAKKLDADDKNRKQEEDRKRARVLDEFFMRKAGLMDHGVAIGPDGNPIAKVVRHETEEELAADFHRWVRGEEDFHDQIVRQYKERILEGMARKEQERRLRIEEARRVQEQREQELGEETGITAFTPENLPQDLRGKKARKVTENHIPENAYRWVQPPLPPPSAQEVQDHPYKPPVVEESGQTLDDKINNRIPSIGD